MCPHCHERNRKVVETRYWNGSVYRRSRCESCGKSFVSEEKSGATLKYPKGLVKEELARLSACDTRPHRRTDQPEGPAFSKDAPLKLW